MNALPSQLVVEKVAAPALCQCGCGKPAPLWKQTQRTLGRFAGQPARFLPYHYKSTEERNQKLSKAMKGHPVSEDTKRKIGLKAHARKALRVRQNGYVLIYCPSHPNANHTGHVLEHRLVVEAAIGRFLTNKEFVHHVNFNTSDNRLENLVILTPSEHTRLHRRLENENAG